MFEGGKGNLSSLPTMMPPNVNEPYYLMPSVGSYEIGTVIMQKNIASCYKQPIYFANKVLT